LTFADNVGGLKAPRIISRRAFFAVPDGPTIDTAFALFQERSVT